MNPELQTDVIALKHFAESDAEILFHLIDRNRDHLGRWLSWVPTMTTVEGTEKKIREWSEEQKKGDDETFCISYQATPVGVISLNYINKIDKYAEIGYWLDRDHQGNGVVTESCKLLINYGFQNIGLHRIEISCAVGNDKSRAIAERLGFTREGTARESGFLHGKFIDHDWYSLLANEWKS